MLHNSCSHNSAHHAQMLSHCSCSFTQSCSSPPHAQTPNMLNHSCLLSSSTCSNASHARSLMSVHPVHMLTHCACSTTPTCSCTTSYSTRLCFTCSRSARCWAAGSPPSTLYRTSASAGRWAAKSPPSSGWKDAKPHAKRPRLQVAGQLDPFQALMELCAER